MTLRAVSTVRATVEYWTLNAFFCLQNVCKQAVFSEKQVAVLLLL